MTDTSRENWLADQKNNGWEMPAVSRWKTLPVIRHFRAVLYSYRVFEHEAFWLRNGLIPTGYDRWVLYGIRRGWENTNGQ